MNEFHGNGYESFAKSGLSAQEKAVEKDEHNVSFRERAEKLKDYAEKLAHDARKAALVHGLLRKAGRIEFLTDEDYEKFADEHPDFFDEGPVVLAIAEALEREKRSAH